MLKLRTPWLAIFVVVACSNVSDAQRIRDFARVEGVRPLQLVGNGLITGLAGTGDSAKSPIARQMFRAYMKRFGLEIDDKMIRSRNIAVVMVTASVPSWTKTGSKIEVTVSSVGDAKSLQGGLLLTTHMDRESLGSKYPLAVAQGRVTVSGEVLTVGKATATVESDLSFPIVKDTMRHFNVILDVPDFSTASRVASAINTSPYLHTIARDELPLAETVGFGEIKVKVPKAFQNEKRVFDFVSRVMSDVQVDDVDPEARVVIDSKSGGISVNGRVRVAPVVVIYKGLEIAIGTKDANDTGNPADPNANKRQLPTNRRSQLLVDVMADLKRNNLTDEDMPTIIRLIEQSGSLMGKLIER